MKYFKQFHGAASGFRAYWTAYGGWRAYVGSPYLVAALLLTGLMAPLWLKANWWDMVLNVLPSILGFSLGGFAIFLAFGDDGFRNLIGGHHPDDKPDEQSPYIEFSATFFHFIVVQVVAIILSLFAKSFFIIQLPNGSAFTQWNNIVKPIWWALGFASFFYAILSALALALAIFGLARSFDDYLTEKRLNNSSEQKK